MKTTSWVTLLALGAIIGVVVWSSFQTGHSRCEVCMTFEGQQVCRTVDGSSEDEARRAAITNACAFLASGVTRTMACERGTPVREQCGAR